VDRAVRPVPTQEFLLLVFSRTLGALKNLRAPRMRARADDGISLRSASSGERFGTANTRSFRFFLPPRCRSTSSTPTGLHFSTTSLGIMDDQQSRGSPSSASVEGMKLRSSDSLVLPS
jgi:hypothetical protein